MKQFILFLILVFAINIQIQAQCHTNICNSVHILPIENPDKVSDDTSSYKCFTNLINGPGEVPLNINFGEYNHLSFNSIEPNSYINILSSVPVFENQTLHINGDMSISELLIDSQNGPVNIYVEDNSYVEVVELIYAAGYNNYIHLGDNSVFTINGLQYNIGDTIVIFEKPKVWIYVLECPQPILLSVNTEIFFEKDYVLYWVTEGNTITIQRFEDNNWLDQYTEVGTQRGSYSPEVSGYYRIVTDYGTSKPIKVKVSYEDYIIDFMGNRIVNPEIGVAYIRNGKPYMILN